jgi:enolase
VRDAINVAKASGLKCIVSHRSGETTDDFIADLAFGWQADYLKAGIVGKEREAKLKRMIAIEKSLRGL